VDWFTPEHLRPYYDTVEGQLALHTFTPNEYNKNAQMFTKACDELGVKWGSLRKGQGDCAHERGNDCINCLGGCYRDSKQSSLVGYVQKGEKEGLQIAAETEIDRIETGDTVTILGTSKGQKVSYTAKNLVVAGGSFGTTKLLLQSGFKKQLPALGKYFTSHPQFMCKGVFDEPLNAQRSYIQTVASEDANLRTKGFKLENVFAPPISMAVLYNRTGPRHQQFMGRYNNMACIEVAVRDENTGEIAVKGNKLVVQKKLTDQDKRRRDEGVALIKNILLKQGAKEVIQSPYYIGLHLMGGSVIGTDATKSVVDPEFRVHGHKNIFIADSSIYPNAPGINPSLTIMALAQKLSEQLIAQR
jgi:choline dehydrogenase-like flavoprotein